MSLSRFFTSDIFSNEFRSLCNEMDRAFGATMPSAAWPGSSFISSFSENQFVPRVKLSEEADRYNVEAEVPGFPKEALNLHFQDDRTLMLSGKYEQEHREEPQPEQQTEQQQQQAQPSNKNGGKDSTAVSKTSGETQVSTFFDRPRIWRNERISQSFQRQISFPSPINQDAVQASLDHGILKLVVPKLEEQKHRKRIEIA